MNFSVFARIPQELRVVSVGMLGQAVVMARTHRQAIYVFIDADGDCAVGDAGDVGAAGAAGVAGEAGGCKFFICEPSGCVKFTHNDSNYCEVLIHARG